MSNSEQQGAYVLVREKIPYSGKGVDQLLATVRQLLKNNPYTQEITCRVGGPIEIAKLVTPEEAPPSPSLHDAIRTKRMEEYVPEKGVEPYQQLWSMFRIIQEEGLEVSHLAVGDKFTFQDWLKVRISQIRMNVFGVGLHVVKELPADVFVVCGSGTKEAGTDEIEFSIKGVTQ